MAVATIYATTFIDRGRWCVDGISFGNLRHHHHATASRRHDINVADYHLLPDHLLHRLFYIPTRWVTVRNTVERRTILQPLRGHTRERDDIAGRRFPVSD